MDDLEQALLAAHANSDHAKLIELYSRAGDEKLDQDDIDAACFYFTHAYVFALECGSPKTQDLNAKLVKFGREVEQSF